jgi:membrane-associated protease RseP (regulator of RpoE activity)
MAVILAGAIAHLIFTVTIPLLDGGASLFNVFGWARGRTPSAWVQALTTSLAVAILACLSCCSRLPELQGFELFDWLAAP